MKRTKLLTAVIALLVFSMLASLFATTAIGGDDSNIGALTPLEALSELGLVSGYSEDSVVSRIDALNALLCVLAENPGRAPETAESDSSADSETASVTPEDTVAGSANTTAIPDDTTAIPDDTTAIPDDTTAVPDDTTAIPDDTTAVPDDTTAIPDDTTAVPGDTTAIPDAPADIPEMASFSDDADFGTDTNVPEALPEQSTDVAVDFGEFSDVGEDILPRVALAADMGIVLGDPFGYFSPYRSVTLTEMLTMCLRALGYSNVDHTNVYSLAESAQLYTYTADDDLYFYLTAEKMGEILWNMLSSIRPEADLTIAEQLIELGIISADMYENVCSSVAYEFGDTSKAVTGGITLSDTESESETTVTPPDVSSPDSSLPDITTPEETTTKVTKPPQTEDDDGWGPIWSP